MTSAWMWAAIREKLGDPIGNAKVGSLIKTELIRSGTDLPTALNAMNPQPRTAALESYLAEVK